MSEYTPSESVVRESYARFGARDIRTEAFDRFIAKVKRDAAREALDGLAAQEAELHSRDLDVYKECDHAAMVAKLYRDTHYPEDVTP